MLTIHYYAIKGETKKIDALLRKSHVDINSKTSMTGSTPLLLACEKGYLPIVFLLLEWGADPSICDFSGHNPLLVAIVSLISNSSHIPEQDLYTIIKLLLRKNISLLESKNQECSLTPFELTMQRPDVRERILKIIKEIDPNHPLLLPTETSSRQQAAITTPTREELPIIRPVTPESLPQSGIRYRGHSQPKEQQPQPVEMTAGSSSKRPRTASKPTSQRSLLSSALAFFGLGGSSEREYQRLPTNAPDESQKPLSVKV